MSHYAVAVFTDGDVCVEELLAPFSENLEVDTYTSKEDLIKSVRDDIEKYRTGSIYQEYLQYPDAYKEKYKDNEDHIKFISEEFPKRLAWSDEQCYQYALRDYNEEDILPDGSVHSTYNPDSRWDWYEVGGRFSDEVPLLDGSFADEADMCDVNADYRNQEAYQQSLRFWHLYIDGEEPQAEEDKELLRWCFYRKEYYTKRYKDAEEYAADCADFGFYSALLPSGEWLEAGKMGWFGCSYAESDDEIRWRDTQKQIIKEAKEKNWHITMVDCHI